MPELRSERAELGPVTLLAEPEAAVATQRQHDHEHEEEVASEQVEPAEVRDYPVEDRLRHGAEAGRRDHTPQYESQGYGG
jgi:hypothetical protein